MEHEAGSGWTGSPAQVSDENNRGNGVATPDAVADADADEVGNGVATPDAVADADEAEAGNGVATPDAVAAGNAGGTEDEPGTGNERVDAALRLLDRLPGLPVSEHPQLFEQVHAQLSEVLGELESGSVPGPAGR